MAKWLGWIDDAGNTRPVSGRHSVDDVVSHTAPVQAKLRVKAAELAELASLRLDTVPKERTGASQIHLQKRDLDWIVYLDEGQVAQRKGGSMGIENRHHILGDSVRQMGG